ncbi:Uncharacterized protein FKW44_010804 [Caligus rogercresseyi]|uniref:C2H2-type domain-containing protein n=1 Tax=Caligus rogercresseyi TaxID=217165 RepID=A0A7T8HH37_CALRO|nr:Uncharacterized protein FKW44_010804 [Caligus rogercresseyi]
MKIARARTINCQNPLLVCEEILGVFKRVTLIPVNQFTSTHLSWRNIKSLVSYQSIVIFNMGKKSIRYLDQKLTEDSSLSSMMIIVPLEDGNARFDCKICGRNYRHHPSLFRHFRSAHKEQYAKCLALRKRIHFWASPTHAERTASNKTDPAPLPNLEIHPSDIASDSPVALEEIKMDVENIPPLVFVDLFCKVCSQEFDSEKSLILHMPECQEKQTLLSDLDSLIDNNDMEPTALEIPSAPLSFPCTYCKYNFVDESSLEEHMRTAHFDYTMTLNQPNEMNAFSINQSVACSHCNKIFENENNFYQHICMGNLVLQVINA